MSKKIEGVSNYYKDKIEMGELAVRETFLRSVKSALDAGGIDQYAVDKIKGMVDMLEEWLVIEKEQDE